MAHLPCEQNSGPKGQHSFVSRFLLLEVRTGFKYPEAQEGLKLRVPCPWRILSLLGL